MLIKFGRGKDKKKRKKRGATLLTAGGITAGGGLLGAASSTPYHVAIQGASQGFATEVSDAISNLKNSSNIKSGAKRFLGDIRTATSYIPSDFNNYYTWAASPSTKQVMKKAMLKTSALGAGVGLGSYGLYRAGKAVLNKTRKKKR